MLTLYIIAKSCIVLLLESQLSWYGLNRSLDQDRIYEVREVGETIPGVCLHKATFVRNVLAGEGYRTRFVGGVYDPQTFKKDRIYHAWVEYTDKDNVVWIVDPTLNSKRPIMMKLYWFCWGKYIELDPDTGKGDDNKDYITVTKKEGSNV